jgi:hypothetical protein
VPHPLSEIICFVAELLSSPDTRAPSTVIESFTGDLTVTLTTARIDFTVEA